MLSTVILAGVLGYFMTTDSNEFVKYQNEQFDFQVYCPASYEILKKANSDSSNDAFLNLAGSLQMNDRTSD